MVFGLPWLSKYTNAIESYYFNAFEKY